MGPTFLQMLLVTFVFYLYTVAFIVCSETDGKVSFGLNHRTEPEKNACNEKKYYTKIAQKTR